MKKRAVVIFAVLCLLFCSACHAQERGTEALLRGFLSLCPLADGQIYTSCATAEEKEHLSEETAALLFAEENGELSLSICSEYALYLSPHFSGGEVGVFRCRSHADAAAVRKMLCARLGRLSRYAPKNESFIWSHGLDVWLISLPDGELAREILTQIY